jgi:hypothetical protein
VGLKRVSKQESGDYHWGITFLSYITSWYTLGYLLALPYGLRVPNGIGSFPI